MILLVFLLCVPVVLLTWRLCVVAGEADERMEAWHQKMMMEKPGTTETEGDDPPDKEGAHAG